MTVVVESYESGELVGVEEVDSEAAVGAEERLATVEAAVNAAAQLAEKSVVTAKEVAAAMRDAQPPK